MILLQRGYSGRETSKAMEAAIHLGYEYVVGDVSDYGDGVTPVGSVEFCELCLGFSPLPYYYPLFLRGWLHRDVGSLTGPGSVGPGSFVKSGCRYKDDSFVETGIQESCVRVPAGKSVWVSDPVEFVNEWRYYVADGEVYESGWYEGIGDEKPAPELGVKYPEGFCGAVDFGELKDGRIALVESHHPYACGWYGDDHELYLWWLIQGWECMRRLLPSLQLWTGVE